MIRASFLYRASKATRFDFAYYLDRHVPFARRLLSGQGLLKLEVDRGVSGEEPGSPAPYICVVHLFFDRAEDFYRAMTAVGDELGRDVPNYTDAEIETQVSEVAS